MLDFRSAVTIRNAVIWLKQTEDPGAGFAEILGLLTEQYVLCGITSWTLVDSENDPVPVTKANIRERLLERADMANLAALADAADGLYAEKVMLPLAASLSASSPRTPTDASTSVPSGSQSEPQKLSKPSSTTSSQTDGTEPTSISRGGDSSTSPKSKSVA